MYLALVLGIPSPPKGSVETLIGRHPSNRLKMAVVNRNGKDAITHYQIKQAFHDTLALVECRLATGRTHQIRVHMEHLGHPLIGDPLYKVQTAALKARLRKGGYEGEGASFIEAFPRQALHAAEIKFIHPESQKLMSFTSPLPEDFSALVQACL